MKKLYILFIIILSSCNSPEPYSREWFIEKLADPDWEFREEARDIMQSIKDEAYLIEKNSISSWLMDDDFLNSSSSKEAIYLKTLKVCAANFSVMYGFAEAGKISGKTLKGVIDEEEIIRLSEQYDNHSYYFYTRALEIQTINFDDTNWVGDGITHYDMKDAAISKEISTIRDDMYSILSNDSLIELLEGNETICYTVRRQNPNNQDYIFDQ